MRLQVYDSDGSIGGGNKLADTLSKAFFGDGEAAAKIALAKAQIATQAKHADYYGAQTAKTAQETAIARAQDEANRRAGIAQGEVGAQTVPFPKLMNTPAPVVVEGQPPGTPAPAPVPVEIQGPVPPAQIDLYKAKQEAERAKAAAIMRAGGNAQQMAQGANLLSGGQLVLHSPDPDQVRRGAILTTGNLPTKDTVTVAGDTAGINAGLAADIAKENAKPVYRTDPVKGTTTQIIRDPTVPGGVREIPVPGIEGKKPDQASNEVVDARLLTMNEKIQAFKEGKGLAPTVQEARQYSADMQARHGTEAVDSYDKDTRETIRTIRIKSPLGFAHPNEVLAIAGPAAAPAPGQGAAAAPGVVTPAAPVVPAAPVASASPIERGIVIKPPVSNISHTAEAERARAFASEVSEAVRFFGGNFTRDNIPKNLWKVIAAIPTDSAARSLFFQSLPDDATKQYMIAALSIVDPGLRFVSGAVINPNETIKDLMKIIPLPGEGQEIINQKLALMAAKARSLGMAGHGGEGTPEYQAWKDRIKARGFDIDRSYEGTAANLIKTRRSIRQNPDTPAPVSGAPPATGSSGAPADTGSPGAPVVTRRRKWNPQTNQFEE